LSTDSCIFAIRNFTARKGLPLEFVSDRGTNFVGASRELKEAAALIDVDRICASRDTKWVFNPPAAPHFGGSWERLIQSIKKTLASFDLPHHPTDELLRARLSEVELIVNSRPLTEIPLEDEAESPLTPNHFILGSSNGSKPPLPFDDSTPSVRRTWKSVQQFADMFWKRWVTEYLPTLTKRTKWYQPTRLLAEGDLVLVADGNNPRNCWPRGRIIKVYRAADNQVRRVTIQTGSGLIERP
uniref:Integrase catalytic domain-containing protein n=1 Tax=Anopheles christyi TaxID=43041 RepID=A0A182KHK0_9DIPT